MFHKTISNDIILKSEQYMLQCMEDSAHDKEHVYRVLNIALDIANTEKDVDLTILAVSCLLHDIGRTEQYKNPAVCHAEVGADMAYEFLVNQGVTIREAEAVRKCIVSHRYRSSYEPEGMEAKILFDADTLEAAGATGIARTLAYEGKMGIPVCHTDSGGVLIDGKEDQEESFFHEYQFKLKKVYERLYTRRGREIGEKRKQIAADFYESLYDEMKSYQKPWYAEHS